MRNGPNARGPCGRHGQPRGSESAAMRHAWRWAIASLLLAPLCLLILTAGRGLRASDVWQATWSIAAWNTLLLALATSAGAGLLGAFVAWALTHVRLPALRWLREAVLFPAALPPLLMAMGFFDLYPLRGLPAMIVVSVVAFAPWVIAPVSAALERTDGALSEAARLSGASPSRAFVSVTWPLVRGEWLACVGVVFSAAAASFGVPYFFSTLSAGRPRTLTLAMADALNAGALSQSLAAAVPLLALSLTANALIRRTARADVQRAAATPARDRSPLASALLWLYAGAAVALPLAALALRATARDPARLFGARSARALVGALTRPEATAILGRSLLLATGAAAAVTLVGVMFARHTSRAARVPALLYALPGTLLALAWVALAALHLRVRIGPLRIALVVSDTLWLLGLVYVSKYLYIGMESARTAMQRLAPALTDAARLSGASAWRAFLSITLPLIRRPLAATFALVWVTLFPELTLSVLLFGPHTETAGTWLFDLATYTDPAQGAALALLIAGITILFRAAFGYASAVRA